MWRSGTWSSPSTIATRPGACTRFPGPRWIPAWGSSASRPSCRGSTATTTSMCSARSSAPSPRWRGRGDRTRGPRSRSIADHIRSCAFIAAEGVVPANEGRGYVLRRIIRRAIRHGSALGIAGPFFHQLVAALAREMGETYPRSWSRHRGTIERVLSQEEERFAETLEHGLKVLERSIAGLRGKRDPRPRGLPALRYLRFPVDLTADIARERGLRLDMDGIRGGDGEAARARPGREPVRQPAASGTILPVTRRCGDHPRPRRVHGLCRDTGRGSGAGPVPGRGGRRGPATAGRRAGCRGPRPNPFLRRSRRPNG